MKFILERGAALLAAVIVIAGCAPVYVPSAQQTHLLDKKGDLSVGGFAGTNGVDAQIAYAFTDHLGISGAISIARNGEEGEENYKKHRYGEVGVQYQNKIENTASYEFIIGYGRGSAWAKDYSGLNGLKFQSSAKGQYQKFFAQSNIGFKMDRAEAGFNVRLGRVIFTELETENEILLGLDTEPTIYTDNQGATYLEPGIFGRIGSENVKIEGQVGLSFPLKKLDNIPYEHQFLLFALGIRINIPSIFSRQ